jgi:hypothetical protein
MQKLLSSSRESRIPIACDARSITLSQEMKDFHRGTYYVLSLDVVMWWSVYGLRHGLSLRIA